jgi:hypothetical protein
MSNGQASRIEVALLALSVATVTVPVLSAATCLARRWCKVRRQRRASFYEVIGR